MKKEYRVKTKQDFQKVISSKNKINCATFVIYYLNTNNNYARFGISASKKLGHAVTRVKIRRQVRMMIHNIQKEFNLQNLDYVIIVRKTYLDNDYQYNQNQFINLLKKFGGITNENKE